MVHPDRDDPDCSALAVATNQGARVSSRFYEVA
jgi:hypothetical protein